MKIHIISFSDDSYVPNECKFLSFGERFMSFDSGIKEDERIIIFCTKNNLNNLKSSKLWFVDSTFKVFPKGFEQLLIIQGLLNNKKYPFIFCIMKIKMKFHIIEYLNILK